MGFWDDDVENGFDRMFDLDRDGKLNRMEKGMQLEFMSGEFEDEFEDDEINLNDDMDDDFDDDSYDDFDSDFSSDFDGGFDD